MTSRENPCVEYEQIMSRRDFFRYGASAFAAMWSDLPGWMPTVRLADPNVGPRGDTLVCIFLRGGSDGLNMIVPHGDDHYYQQRFATAIPRPDQAGSRLRAIDVDGFFGLHPALGPLEPIVSAGDLALVQAVGSPDTSHSHFQAMAEMERGAFTGGIFSGWLARHLNTLNTGNESALRAIGVGEMLPASLVGAEVATALRDLDSYTLSGDTRAFDALRSLYAYDDSALAQSARQTLHALQAVQRIRGLPTQSGAGYPDSDFGRAMRLVARLIKAEVGVEVACIDKGGWDTHAAQGGSQGVMANHLEDLAAGLAAFYEESQESMQNITVVVMSEFGRRVRENAALGTDHGGGNMMMLCGGGILGGYVYADWPGLHPEQLDGPGDLAITRDYRDVLWEIVQKRLNNSQPELVFPEFSAREFGLAESRE